MGDAVRVQTRFSDAEEVMAVVGGALERGWLRLPLKVTNEEPFEIVLVAADGAQALRSFAEVVEPAGTGTWIRFLTAAPAAETERGSRCMIAEVDIETGDAANDDKTSDEAANDDVPALPAQSRRGVLDVLPTVKMPALARASVPALPPLLPPPPAPSATPPAAADSIANALLAIEPERPSAPIAFDTSDVTGEAKLLADGEIEAKIAAAVAEESVAEPSIDTRGLGNELGSVAGEIRRDTDASPPIDLEAERVPADSTIPAPFAHAPAEPASLAASLAAAVGARSPVRVSDPIMTEEVTPLGKPRSNRAVIVASAALCLAAAIALVVVSTSGKSAHADAPSMKQTVNAPVVEKAHVVSAPESVAPEVVAPAEVVAPPEAVTPPAPAPAKAHVAAPIQPPVQPAIASSACSIVIAASIEDAQVMIDGQARGETPVTADVPCGQPVAVTVHHPRYEVFKTTITANGQESMIAKLERETAKVTVTSDPPGATVTLNGASIGKTPLTTKVNRYEQSTLNFSYPGYEADWRRIMPKTGTSQVSIKLRAALFPPGRH